MITHDCSTKFGNIVLEIYQVLALFMLSHVVEMDVFVSPFKIMYDPFVGQLLLHNENGLEEVNYSFLDVEVIEFGNHCLLVFEVSFVLIDKRISFVDYVSDVIKDSTVRALIQLFKLVSQVLIFLFFAL